LIARKERSNTPKFRKICCSIVFGLSEEIAVTSTIEENLFSYPRRFEHPTIGSHNLTVAFFAIDDIVFIYPDARSKFVNFWH
jgi:hypothetical protein